MITIKKSRNGCKAVVATAQHAKQLAPFLRQHDKDELIACGFDTPEKALMKGLEIDDVTLTALDAQGVPFAMLGVGRAPNMNYIWLLGSEGVRDNWLTFGKASKQLLPYLIKRYGVVSNYVLAEYTTSIKWLKWLGAEFEETPIKFSGHDFYKFNLTYPL